MMYAKSVSSPDSPVDFSPLAWVMDGLRKALEAAVGALRLAEREDDGRRSSAAALAMSEARDQLHQAAGALDMVGQQAPGRLIRAMESVVLRWGADPSGCTKVSIDVIESAGFAVCEFLEGVIAGNDHDPVALFAQYRDVQAMAGASRAHPADLWRLEWSWRPVPHLPPSPPLSGAAAERARFDAALLQLLREGQPQAARDLAALALGLAQGARETWTRSFWALVAGFFEALALQRLDWDLHAKRSASRILQAFSIQHAQAPASPALEEAARDLTFFCALADGAGQEAAPLLAAVASAWGLAAHRPASYQGRRFGRFNPALMMQVRKQLGDAREGWSQLAGGDTSRMRTITDQFMQLRDALVRLHAPLGGLAASLLALVQAQMAAGAAPDPAAALEGATAVLFLEMLCQDFDPDRPGLSDRIQALSDRLDHVRQGHPALPLEPWMEELYRGMSHRQTLGSVVDELRGSLRELERDLDAYFRSAHDVSILERVPARLSQMRGVLSVLGLDHAVQAVVAMREVVEALSSSQERAPLQDVDRLGNNLGALGFLVDMLSYQPALARTLFVFDPNMAELQAVVGRSLPAVRPQGAESEEPGADPRSGSMRQEAPAGSLAPTIGSANPADPDQEAGPQPAALEFDLQPGPGGEGAVPKGMPRLPEVPPLAVVPGIEVIEDDLQGLLALGHAPPPGPAPAPVSVAAPEAASASDVGSAFEPSPGRASPAPAAPEAQPPRPDVLPLAAPGSAAVQRAAPDSSAPSDAGDRQAMLDIFLEEAKQVLEQAAVALDVLPIGKTGARELAQIRRAFHTVKGSARMVGLEALGEAAWALEQAFNEWIDDAQPVDAGLKHLAGRGLEGLARWVMEIESKGQAQIGSPGDPSLVPVVGSGGDTSLGASPGTPWTGEYFVQLVDGWRAAARSADALPPAEPESLLHSDLTQVFLDEAEPWSARLQGALDAWAEGTTEVLDERVVALAHSLAGSSATVGLRGLAQLARELEACLMATLRVPASLARRRACQAAADDIRRLLHQFAAGFIKEPDPRILQALVAATVDDPGTDGLDPDLFPIFEEEALHLLPRLADALRHWQADPATESFREDSLRVLHTLKGSARLAGARALGEAAHALESRIEALAIPPAGPADGDSPGNLVEPLLWACDRLTAAFDDLRRPTGRPAGPTMAVPTIPSDPLPPPAVGAGPSPQPPQAPPHNGQEALSAVASPGSWPSAASASASAISPAPTGSGAAASQAAYPPTAWPVAQAVGAVRVRADLLDRLLNESGEVMITRDRLDVDMRQLRGSLQDLTGNLDRLRGQLRDVEIQAEMQMQSRMAQTRDPTHGFDPLELDRFTRMQELTRMMAESVNDIATVQRQLQATVVHTQDDLASQARQARALQRDLLRTRMVPVEGQAERLHRVVRQAARDAGKQAALTIEGGRIEIDRSVIERITPAFEHLLRNAVAHGIESPSQRLAAGKPQAGAITLRLTQQGNEVCVLIEDDGAGLNLARIEARSREMGLLGPGQACSPQAATEMIFKPGFSTAPALTELAGRGIGMDVVRSEVQALGGRVEVESRPGIGTRFLLVLPLTTAVTQLVLVRCADVQVGIPSHLVQSVARLSPREVQQGYNAGELSVDGVMAPFLWGGAVLQASRRSTEPTDRPVPLLVLRSASQVLALHVDEVLGHHEVVVKALGPQLMRLPGLVGMTVLASGAIVPIYNPVALAAVHAEAIGALSADRAQPEVLGDGQPPAMQAQVQAQRVTSARVPLVLVVDDSITVRRVTQRLLEREGWRVALAADGLEALERLAQETPDLVLSDIEMPRMDGFELARTLRDHPAWAHLPMVMISSRSADKHRERAQALGVTHFLGKPYPEAELLSLVRRYALNPSSS